MEERGVTGAVQPGSRATSRAASFGGRAGAVDETGDGQHLAVEVAGVKLLTPDGLVDTAQLGDRELGIQERSG